jgi:DNA-binding response OmpR family regulator
VLPDLTECDQICPLKGKSVAQVLVLSQEPLTPNSWTSLISQRGYSVRVEAMDEISPSVLPTERPRLVVLDFDAKAPVAQGIQALHDIRRVFPNAQIMALSPREWPLHQVGLLRRQADTLLLKPTDYATLLRLIDMLLREPYFNVSHAASPLPAMPGLSAV